MIILFLKFLFIFYKYWHPLLVYVCGCCGTCGWRAEAGGALLSIAEGEVLLGWGEMVAEDPGITNTVNVGLGWGA